MKLAAKSVVLNITTLVCLLFACNLAWADTVYVGELGDGFSHPEIRKFDSSGNWVSFAEDSPYGLAVDDSGNLFASSGDSIVKYDPAGTPSIFSTTGAPSLAFDRNGNLYGCGGSTILRFDSNGNASIFADLGSGHTFQRLAFDASGNVYVGDSYPNEQILKFDLSGTPSVFASGLTGPRGLAFDTSGNLFVGNAGANNILRFDPSGNRSVFANSGLDDIFDLAFDSSGNLLVVNSGGGFNPASIARFDPNGNWSLFSSAVEIPLSIAIQVPEPATWSLLTLGLVALVGSRRVRRSSL